MLYLKPHTDRTQIGIVTIPSGEFSPLTNDVNSYSELALSADGRTLATVLTNVDSSIAYYKLEGGAPISTTPLRITPVKIAWADEDHLLFIVEGISIGSLDRATGNLRTFEVGDVDVGHYFAACPDGHILFTGFPKGGGGSADLSHERGRGDLAQITTNGIGRRPFCSARQPGGQSSPFEAGATRSLSWSIPSPEGRLKSCFRCNMLARRRRYRATGSWLPFPSQHS